MKIVLNQTQCPWMGVDEIAVNIEYIAEKEGDMEYEAAKTGKFELTMSRTTGIRAGMTSENLFEIFVPQAVELVLLHLWDGLEIKGSKFEWESITFKYVEALGSFNRLGNGRFEMIVEERLI